MNGDRKDIGISFFFHLIVLPEPAEVLPTCPLEGPNDPFRFQIRRRDHQPAFRRNVTFCVTAR